MKDKRYQSSKEERNKGWKMPRTWRIHLATASSILHLLHLFLSSPLLVVHPVKNQMETGEHPPIWWGKETEGFGLSSSSTTLTATTSQKQKTGTGPRNQGRTRARQVRRQTGENEKRLCFCYMSYMFCMYMSMLHICEVWLWWVWFVTILSSFWLSSCNKKIDRGACLPFVMLSWYLHSCCIMAVHFADTQTQRCMNGDAHVYPHRRTCATVYLHRS